MDLHSSFIPFSISIVYKVIPHLAMQDYFFNLKNCSRYLPLQILQLYNVPYSCQKSHRSFRNASCILSFPTFITHQTFSLQIEIFYEFFLQALQVSLDP